MEVIVRPNAESVARLAVDWIVKELEAKPNAVLGLATGRTVEPVYEQLVRVQAATGLDFSQCHTFNLDEYVGLGADDPNSYRYFMEERLFRKVNIDRRKTHLPDGLAKNLEQECGRYEELIRAAGGIDLQLLGIGLNGHLGFNEPGSAFDSRTRVETLSAATRGQNAAQFDPPDRMPQRAITMGLATIMDIRRCLLLATGPEKAGVVAQAIEGPVTEQVPASMLQWHLACTIILDEAAAARLQQRQRPGNPALTTAAAGLLLG